MDRPALADLEHENWIACLAASISLTREGLVLREGGVAALLGHVPLHFYNQILIEDQAATEQAVAAAVARGRERGDPFVVSLRDGPDARFMTLMAELGLAADDSAATYAMALHPVRDRARTPDPGHGFEIRQVTDEAGLAQHRRTAAAGFGVDPVIVEEMLRIDLLDRPECAVYVGYLDGVPVSTALGFRTGRTMGVYNIATIPEARRRGFGEAMTARVLTDGEAAGCDVAALQASSMGRPIYERLGFQLAVRYTGYVERSSA